MQTQYRFEILEPHFYSFLMDVTDLNEEKQTGPPTLAQQVSINHRWSEIVLTGWAVNMSSTPSAAHGTIMKQRLKETVPSVAADSPEATCQRSRAPKCLRHF